MRHGEASLMRRGVDMRTMHDPASLPPSIAAIGAFLASIPLERLRLWKAFEPDRHPRWPVGQSDGGRFRAGDADGGSVSTSKSPQGAASGEPSMHPEIDALNVVGCGSAMKLCFNSGATDRLRCVDAYYNCMGNGTHTIFAPGIVGRSGS